MEIIKDAFMIPEEYEIVGFSFDPSAHTVHLTIQSDTFPETGEGQPLPELEATARAETLPFIDPSYRKLIVEYKVKQG